MNGSFIGTRQVKDDAVADLFEEALLEEVLELLRDVADRNDIFRSRKNEDADLRAFDCGQRRRDGCGEVGAVPSCFKVNPEQARGFLRETVGDGSNVDARVLAESGLQSLRNLDDPGACPVVAVRTAGLGLESIIGHAGADDALEFERQHTEGSELYANEYEALVTEDYLGILVSIANERFEANKNKIARFRTCLREAMALQLKKTREAEDWEDAESRRRRKRGEGLRVSHDKKALRNGETVDTVMKETPDEDLSEW